MAFAPSTFDALVSVEESFAWSIMPTSTSHWKCTCFLFHATSKLIALSACDMQLRARKRMTPIRRFSIKKLNRRMEKIGANFRFSRIKSNKFQFILMKLTFSIIIGIRTNAQTHPAAIGMADFFVRFPFEFRSTINQLPVFLLFHLPNNLLCVFN